MEKSKNKLLLIIMSMVLCCVFIFTGCNNQKNNTSDDDTNIETEQEELVPTNTEVTIPINNKFYKVTVTEVKNHTIWESIGNDIVFTIKFFNPDFLGIYGNILYFEFYIEDFTTFEIKMFEGTNFDYSNNIDEFSMKAEAITTISLLASVNSLDRDANRFEKAMVLKYSGVTIFSQTNTETIENA